MNALTKDDAQLAQVFPLLSLNVNDSDLTLATCIGLLGEQPIFAINERSLTVQIQVSPMALRVHGRGLMPIIAHGCPE